MATPPSPDDSSFDIPLISDKQELRLWMRRVRRGLTDRPKRSERIWEQIVDLTELHVAQSVLAFTSVPGEPETASFVSWCEADGKATGVPEDRLDPSWPDVVVVPGLAFTTAGDRLGQGGGWYDRFLAQVRSDCLTIGVCFEDQVLRTVPTEPHDIVLDIVVTDTALHRP